MFCWRHPCVRCQCQTAKMEVRRKTTSAEDQWMCASKTRQMIDASFLSIIMSYVVFYHVSFVYISGLCFFYSMQVDSWDDTFSTSPVFVLLAHQIEADSYCETHHLHAVQRKEAMTLAEMFEMLMKMRAKEHVKRTFMWPGHFVCLALTRPNMCKTDRRMFFLSGFEKTVCESTHPEKIWVVIWFIELNLSQFTTVL